ncbi:Filamentous hemagglutinin transporter protein FhaC precursor, partial [Haemophilus influenzae]
SFTYITY